MELKVLKRLDDVESFKAEWLELLHYSCNKGIHQNYDWFRIGCQTFHQDDELHVLLVFDERKRLTCVAPLIITWRIYRGIKVRSIGFVVNEQSPANDFIFSPGSEEICLALVFEHLASFKHWELIDLPLININGLTGRFVRKFIIERGLAHGLRMNRQTPYIPIDRGWNDFWASRSKRFRKSMRHKLNRAGKQDGLTIEKVTLKDGSAPALAEMIRISRNSWKQKVGTDLSASKDSLNFYKKLCDTWGPRGLIYIWFLKIHEKVVAFEFHIQYKNAIYPIRADFDENYRVISPGSILEYTIIKTIFQEKRVTEYDSCGHTYEYLMNWTDLVKDYRSIEIFKRNLKMMLLHMFEYKMLGFLRRMKFYESFKKALVSINRYDGVA